MARLNDRARAVPADPVDLLQGPGAVTSAALLHMNAAERPQHQQALYCVRLCKYLTTFGVFPSNVLRKGQLNRHATYCVHTKNGVRPTPGASW